MAPFSIGLCVLVLDLVTTPPVWVTTSGFSIQSFVVYVKYENNDSTKQLIQDKLIEKAKELLSTTNLSVSEIAYQLGFDYAQSFSRLFKTKTEVSPLEFRRSFN
ncbi:helix-turn-helix transcriptional regulator [Algoriphagus sp. NG3]|nr:helix-turn-helix transcriptional regulator [Algoriphagus sp. NG3]WPR77350.1 helix-turn-helix transcriptional regulator [Algoriphagus sp. NG3]